MPLPLNGSGQWPPLDLKPYIDQAHAASAWWSGSVDDLQSTSEAGGTTGRRRFWNRRKASEATTATAFLHAPLAADIAAVSSDLIFGDGFQLTTDDQDAQAQLEVLEEQIGLTNLLAEGGEWAAATGGVYLRPAWDNTVADHPLAEVIPQHQAIPDFMYNRLIAVTLWRDIHVENNDVWRLLERHERGKVDYGLYIGSKTDLGDRVNLKRHPLTERMQDSLVLPGRLADRMLVSYVPNVRPNPRLPQKPLGRSDWEGCESMLDALDEVWTSLMRDVRLAQARIIIPQDWLKASGHKPGSTVQVDPDSEVFTSFDIMEKADGNPYQPSVMQPDIRVEAHIEAALALSERIISRAGYSPQTFGLHIEGRADSGTALRVREGKTDKTASKKQRYFGPELRQFAQNLLDIGAEVFNTPTVENTEANPVKVAWPELEQSPEDKATWIKTLREAQAISVRTAITLAQPDLEETAVDEELARIEDENKVEIPDPTLLGRGTDPTDDPQDPQDPTGAPPPFAEE